MNKQSLILVGAAAVASAAALLLYVFRGRARGADNEEKAQERVRAPSPRAATPSSSTTATAETTSSSSNSNCNNAKVAEAQEEEELEDCAASETITPTLIPTPPRSAHPPSSPPKDAASAASAQYLNFLSVQMSVLAHTYRSTRSFGRRDEIVRFVKLVLDCLAHDKSGANLFRRLRHALSDRLVVKNCGQLTQGDVRNIKTTLQVIRQCGARGEGSIAATLESEHLALEDEKEKKKKAKEDGATYTSASAPTLNSGEKIPKKPKMAKKNSRPHASPRK